MIPLDTDSAFTKFIQASSYFIQKICDENLKFILLR